NTPTRADQNSGSCSVFEIDRIRRLVELMKEHDLSEVDLRESRQRIRICRGPEEPARGAYAPPPPPVAHMLPPPPPRHRPVPAAALRQPRARPPTDRISSSSRARWSARST